MKKTLAIILAASLLLLSGCMDVPTDGSSDYQQDTLTKIVSTWRYGIYQHDATGVCYLVFSDGKHVAVTVMLKTDGTPYTGR